MPILKEMGKFNLWRFFMKKIILGILTLSLLIGFNGCSSSSDDTVETPPNNNTYNLRTINTTTGISTLLQGGYSTGVTGSLSIIKLDDGTAIINGIPVLKAKSNTSITLDNGYTSQSSSISLIDDNGFALAFDDTLAYCTLTTDRQAMPTAAVIGAESSSAAIYSCDDSTNRTMSWSLVDAGNGNAYYIFDTVISGALQSENTTTITITPQNDIIYYKVHINIIADGITATFEGDVN